VISEPLRKGWSDTIEVILHIDGLVSTLPVRPVVVWLKCTRAGIESVSARFQVRVLVEEHFEEKNRGSLKSEAFQTTSCIGGDGLSF
jgi:hypothetical protein